MATKPAKARARRAADGDDARAHEFGSSFVGQGDGPMDGVARCRHVVAGFAEALGNMQRAAEGG